MKPIRLTALIEQVGRCLGIDWVKETPKPAAPAEIPVLEAEVCAVLLNSAEVGHERGLRKALDGYVTAGRVPEAFAEQIHDLADTARFQDIASLIRSVPS